MTRINKNQLKVPGGSTGQALVKQSNADYDYDWGAVVGSALSEQNIGGYKLGSNDTDIIAQTSSTDGNKLFLLSYESDSSGLTVTRFEKDPVTGFYKITHSESPAVISDGGSAGMAIIGLDLYILYEGTGGTANQMMGIRCLASDLSGATTLTTGFPAYSGGGSAFSDGTDLYINLSGTTWTQYTISGTTITAGSTITGGMTSATNSFYLSGDVYMIDANSNVNVYTYAGGAFTLNASDSYPQMGFGNEGSTSEGLGVIPISTNIGYVAYKYSNSRYAGSSLDIKYNVIIKPFTLPS